jgi:hypothetical protein
MQLMDYATKFLNVGHAARTKSSTVQ